MRRWVKTTPMWMNGVIAKAAPSRLKLYSDVEIWVDGVLMSDVTDIAYDRRSGRANVISVQTE